MSYRENDPVAPPCPRCSAALFAGRVGHLDALGCGGCGGLWLDNAATTTVLRRFDIDAAQLARRIDGSTVHAEPISPFATASGPCPVCAKPLQSTEHQGSRLDFCEQHGTFFDRGELARVLEQARAVVPAAAPVYQGPSLGEIQTEIRHEAAWQKDSLGTALIDWATGGKDWVNRWRK